jgi:tetratricopeptide (TPR) repeat protein
MQGFIHQARISVSPMMRGRSYSQKAEASFEKAIELNPENPRAYYLWGQNVMNTPSFFGGGKEKACPIFQKAKAKYEAYEAGNSISPRWGETPTMRLAGSCE